MNNESTISDYFISGQIPQFAFYRLPKVLFLSEKYNALSTDAKLLYSLLLDRMELSARNGMHDEQGRIYLYFTVTQASELLHYGESKMTRLFGELERIGLVDRRRQGLGKASIIYPKKYPKKFADLRPSEWSVRSIQSDDSGAAKITVLDPSDARGINTEYINTEVSDTNLSITPIDTDEIEERIKEQIEYEILTEKADHSKVDEVVGILTELMCVRSSSIRIGTTTYPTEYVHQRLGQLTCEHIEYVLDCMSGTNARIGNIKSYLTVALFNAPVTMEHYFQSQINYDFAQ